MSDAERAPLSIEALQPEHTGGIVDLYEACMATAPGIGPITAEIWTGAMRQARFGHGRDFLVAFDGTDLIGLAESSLRPCGRQVRRFLKILVHPAWRRMGLGTKLLSAVLDQGPFGQPVLIESLPRPDWIAGIGFASRFGFAVMETEIFMRAAVLRSMPTGLSGAEIGQADPETTAARAAAIHNAAYLSEASFVPSTREDMLESLRGTSLWTARLEGTVVAFAIVEQEAELTWLESLAVDRFYQARGIGGALAIRALSGDSSVRRPVGLNVSSRNAIARKLYDRLGFEIVSERPRYGIMRDDLLAHLTNTRLAS